MYITWNEFYNIIYPDANNDDMLTPSQFIRYELKARTKLDYYTQNRLKSAESIDKEIKYLMAEMIMLMYKSDKSRKDEIQSVSNDGYSVTYKTTNKKDENELLEVKLYSLITDYATKHCYRGVNKNDKSFLG